MHEESLIESPHFKFKWASADAFKFTFSLLNIFIVSQLAFRMQYSTCEGVRYAHSSWWYWWTVCAECKAELKMYTAAQFCMRCARLHSIHRSIFYNLSIACSYTSNKVIALCQKAWVKRRIVIIEFEFDVWQTHTRTRTRWIISCLWNAIRWRGRIKRTQIIMSKMLLNIYLDKRLNSWNCCENI